MKYAVNRHDRRSTSIGSVHVRPPAPTGGIYRHLNGTVRPSGRPFLQDPAMTNRKIRSIVKSAIGRLELGEHPDLSSIQSWIEAKNGRPIVIGELSTLRGNDVCGLWFLHDGRDYVLHAPLNSSWHRQYVILHEFAHLILGHRCTPTSQLLVDLPGFPGGPIRILGRTSFEDEEEAAAELLAGLLMERLSGFQDVPADPAGFNKVFG